MHWQFGEMEFGEMKRNTSIWSNFGMLLRRAGLTASAGLWFLTMRWKWCDNDKCFVCDRFQLLVKHSLVAALSDMVTVKPRRQIIYPVDRLGANAPSERILRAQEQFALNHVNRKLVLEPKVMSCFCVQYAVSRFINGFSCCVMEVNCRF